MKQMHHINDNCTISYTGKILKQRQVRVAQNVKNIVADIILKQEHFEIRDDNDIVTVVEVEMSNDLKIAYVYVTSLNKKKKQVMQKLQKIAPAISKILGARIRAKYTPKICFRQDEGVDKAHRLAQIFNHKT